jgi:large subunit ribosomal protein L29|tara:strand:- start:819 stop:1037 length:219 start_codon:yes stop_codon:yes gene_type:complete
MKGTQLREMNLAELKIKLDENLEALQNLKFQQALQQLEDGTLVTKTRKEVAQIKTVLNEYKLGLRVSQGEKE